MCGAREGLVTETVDVYSPLPSRVEGRPFSYSDHEAVCAKFRILEGSPPDAAQSHNQEEYIQTLEEALEVCGSAMKALALNKRKYFFIFGVIAILLASLPLSNESSLILHYLLVTARLALTLIAVYCLIMATVWNRIEKHGILAGQLGIEFRLKDLSKSKQGS